MSTITISPSLQRRITTTLFTVQSLFGAALTAMFILTTIVATRLSGQESWAGLPATLVLGGRALVGYPIGWIMDRYGRRAGFVLGYLLGVIGALVSADAIGQGSFWEFCLGATLLGMGRGISEQSRYAAAEVYPQVQRARVIGLLVWAGVIGAIGGPLLVDPASKVAARLSLDAQMGPFLAAAVIAAIAMILTFVYLRPDPLLIGRQLAMDQSASVLDAPARPLRTIFAGGPFQLAITAMIIGQLVMTLIMVITPLHMSHQHHDVQAISWVLMAHTLGMFGLAILTGRLIEVVGHFAVIGSGGLILVAASVMTPIATNIYTLALALFLLGLGWNFCFTAGSSLLANTLTVHERGRAQGFSEALVALAAGAGSLSSGFAFAYGGILLVSAIGLACLLVFLAVIFGLMQRTEPTQVKEIQT